MNLPKETLIFILSWRSLNHTKLLNKNFINRRKSTSILPDKTGKRVPAGLLAVKSFEVGNFVFHKTDQKCSPFISTSGLWEEVGRGVTEKLKAFSEINQIDIEKRVNGVNKTGWWIKVRGEKVSFRRAFFVTTP